MLGQQTQGIALAGTTQPFFRPACGASPAQRPFGSTPAVGTRRRLQMFDWLNREGVALKTYVPGAPYYLTNLIQDRVSGGRKPSASEAGAADAADAADTVRETSVKADADADADPNANAEADADANTHSQTNEADRPLRPFPLNPHFVSESILSEALRNEIYKRVARDKKSLRSVSLELGVDMRRVGAVVRLVELENRWRSQVRFVDAFFVCRLMTLALAV